MKFSKNIDITIKLFILSIVVILLMSLWISYILFKQWTIILFLVCVYSILAIMISYGIKLINQKINFFSKEIIQYIDSMLNDTQVERKNFAVETLSGAIYNKLFRLFSSMKHKQEEVEKNKDTLQIIISDVAHQLKTPMTNLNLVMEQLQTVEVSSDNQEYLLIMESQLDKITMLTEYLIHSSRLETGVLQLESVEDNFYEILLEIVQHAILGTKKPKQKIYIDCPKDIYLKIDSKWTKEAIYNILDNAIKYTGVDGTISIEVKQESLYTKIDIIDTGIGHRTLFSETDC